MVISPTILRRRRGSVLIYGIIAFCVLVGLVAFAVDFGLVTLVKAELRTATDAAALAGCSGLVVSPAEARARAKAYALSNIVNGQPLVLQDSDIELGKWNSTTLTFELLTGSNENQAIAMRITPKLSQANGNAINLIFARILGFDYVETTTSSVGGFAATADVVVVQDITTSFVDELPDAKIADQALLNALQNIGGKSGFGVVVHTGHGKTLAPLQTINGNYTTLTNTISSIQVAGSPGMPVASGTDISSGIKEGIIVFDNFATPSTTGKAMVIVSDGEPSQNSNGSNPSLTSDQLLTLAQTYADNAWAKQIHVYVVFFNQDNNVSSAAKLATLKRGKGDFVQVLDPNDLPAALQSITRKLPMQLLK